MLTPRDSPRVVVPERVARPALRPRGEKPSPHRSRPPEMEAEMLLAGTRGRTRVDVASEVHGFQVQLIYDSPSWL